jgi:lipoprotein-anchoring transpeptidase ErfK/SrfK
MQKLPPVLVAFALTAPAAVPVRAAELSDLTAQAVNAAQFEHGIETAEGANPLVLKAQVLLDRNGASPGVIDAIYGDNVAKAISSFESVHGLPADGRLDGEVWSALSGDDPDPVLIEYEITAEDLAYDFAESIPEDYAEMAKMERLAYTSPEEMLAERFHMDIDLLKALNADKDFSQVGTKILVADVESPPPEGKIARIEADKPKAQLRAYDVAGKLLAAYPATIGSEENPSPSGIHDIDSIALDPVYYYRPDTNFQQGDNDQPLDIPPGPNNPVGTVWIDLSEPTYGIHGTPEPSEVDKTASHGCVRLTNWDAEELAGMVEPGIQVEFLE